MKRLYRLTRCLLMLALIIPAAHSQTRGVPQRPTPASLGPNGNYYALVIGINDYRPPLNHLNTPVHDAQEIAQLLTDRYGFQVKQLLNAQATRSNILDAMTAYQAQLGENDSLLIYYAGHGFSTRKADGTYDKAYWLPADATSSQSANRIIADDLTSDIGQLPARHVLIISDSCYSGGLARDAGGNTVPASDPKFLNKMIAAHSRNLMASGGDEPVSDNGPQNHSIFAAAVIEALRSTDEPVFTAGTIFSNNILPQVAGNSNQVPEYGFIRSSGHISGDFVFVQRDAARTVAASTVSATPVAPLTSLTREVKTDFSAIDQQGFALFNAKRYAEALPLFTQACDGGSEDACSHLGLLYGLGEGVPQDFAKALALHTKACDNGSLKGCSNLGNTYLSGQGVPRDFGKAAALYQRACDGGIVAMCIGLGALYQNGQGVTRDFDKAFAIYSKACNGTIATGCGNLGTLYELGQGVPQDGNKAAALYTQACDEGDAHGCINLGTLYREGRGVPQDYAKSVHGYTRACDGGDQDGCTNLGYLYANGYGLARDYNKAKALYSKACDAGNAAACSNFGDLYRHGLGVTADAAVARQYLKKGCDMGNQWGCDKLKEMK